MSYLSKLANKIFSNIPAPHRQFFNSYFLTRKHDRKTQLSPYMILRAKKEDYDLITKLMHENYYPNEPTIFTLGIKKNAALDEEVLRALEEGLSLVAKCKYNGEIAGVCVNQSSHPWDPDLKEKLACNVECTQVKKLLLFQAYVQRMPKLWNCYGVKKIFEISHLFTCPPHKNQGLEYRLLRDSKVLGADCGFNVIRCNATTAVMSELCKQVRMQMIAEIPYKSYVTKDLKVVINSPYPNESVKIYVDENPQMWYVMNTEPGPKACVS